MKKYALYFSIHCYFCQKVMSSMQGKGHQIELRNISTGDNLMELKIGGGMTQVPCLRIEEAGTGEMGTKEPDKDSVSWLYESDEILSYIKTNNLMS